MNYKALRDLCQKNSSFSLSVIDDFLLDFAAGHHGLEKKMNQLFARYRQVSSKFGKETVELFKTQFIIHKVFKEDGLIEKFLRNPALDRFRGEERKFLIEQAKVPWRFSFAEILEEPEKDFFLMRDVFSADDYLLFSPSMTQLKSSGNIILWFNLIGYNGSCWQSYGPIVAFQSFEPDDIFFFATEKNPDIEDEAGVIYDIDNDPIPYMMLISGASYPRTFNANEEMIYLMAEHDLQKLNTAALKKSFVSEYDKGVYRFNHKELGGPPHFASIYYNEEESILLLQAMTKTGFSKLINDFNSFGYNFPDIPFLQVRPQMVATAESILRRKIVLNEYEDLFHVDVDPQVSEEVAKINTFMGLVLPDINDGRFPDIEIAARTAGLDIKTAEDLVNMTMEKRNNLPGNDRKNPPGKPVSHPPEKTWTEEQVSHPIEKIYRIADYIRDLEPWNDLYETDIFGIKIPESNRIYFISVMGSNGEYTAISAYKGYKGLFDFFKFQEEEDSSGMNSLLTIPQIILGFTDREDLEKSDLEAIKRSGLKFRGKGKWPKLHEIIPGFYPSFPEGETFEDLPVLLEQIATFLPWVMDNYHLIYREAEPFDEILVRVPSKKSGKLQWESHYETLDPEKAKVFYKLTYKSFTLDKVLKLNKASVTFLIDLIILPAPVKNTDNKGAFPFILLIVDKETGMVCGMPMMTPERDLSALYESLPQKTLEVFNDLGYKPSKIEIRSKLLYELLYSILKKIGCPPILVDEMPVLDETVESLLDHLHK